MSIKHLLNLIFIHSLHFLLRLEERIIPSLVLNIIILHFLPQSIDLSLLLIGFMLNLDLIVHFQLLDTLLQVLNVSLQFVSFGFLDQVDVFGHLDLNELFVFFTGLLLVYFDFEHTEYSILAY